MSLVNEPIIVPTRGCKFITGHPGESGWSYCGKKTVSPSSPWCEEHYAVVYGKAKPKAKPKVEAETTSPVSNAAPKVRGTGSLEDPMLMG